MLYLVNFSDPNDKEIQMNLIIETDKGKKEILQIIKDALKKSKKIWNKDDCDKFLNEILTEEISKKLNILNYTYLEFDW